MGKKGRRVDCNYIRLRQPVETVVFRDAILRYRLVKYNPFDQNGGGNTGYLFELHRELAKAFLKGLIVKNPDLLSYDFVKPLLDQ